MRAAKYEDVAVTSAQIKAGETEKRTPREQTVAHSTKAVVTALELKTGHGSRREDKC